MSERKADTERFYELMGELEEQVGGQHLLRNFASVVSPGDKGVYFIFEPGEIRRESVALRVVRIGTHGLRAKSRSTIWTRLFEHLMFNGRSVFRDHINAALLNRNGISKENLGHRHSACITDHIGQMRLLWVRIDGDGGHVKRHKVEKNAIALLSDFHGAAIDKPSPSWLGRHRVDACDVKRNHAKLAKSGLWNVDFVGKKKYDQSFLDDLGDAVKQTLSLSDAHRREAKCSFNTQKGTQ